MRNIVEDGDRIDMYLQQHDEAPFTPIDKDHFLSEAKLLKFSKIFPPVMPLFWQKYPIGSILNGAFCLCDPNYFSPLMPLIFRGDPDFDPERTHVYAYTAFGRMIAWNEEHGAMEIDMIEGRVSSPSLLHPEDPKGRNLEVIGKTETFDSLQDLDEKADDDGKWLYNRTKKKLGPLSYGEVYGFAPALPMGGEMSLSTVRKYDALTHFSFLAQLLDFVLMDYLARPIREVRRIGPQ